MKKLYHRTVCWKPYFDAQSINLIKTFKGYSYHMIKDHFENVDYKHDVTEENLTLIIRNIQTLKSIKPYEVEAEDGRVTKCVVRVSYDNTRDVSIVFRHGKVVTAWLNNKDDVHTTLDKRKYAQY